MALYHLSIRKNGLSQDKLLKALESLEAEVLLVKEREESSIHFRLNEAEALVDRSRALVESAACDLKIRFKKLSQKEKDEKRDDAINAYKGLEELATELDVIDFGNIRIPDL